MPIAGPEEIEEPTPEEIAELVDGKV
jgi:hypothetical protein